MQKNNKNNFLDSITSLRGILALWVVMHHFNFCCFTHKFDFSIFEPITSKGYYAVDGFFILSGFIVSYVYMEKLSTFNLTSMAKFLILRLARIYPIHIVTILAYVFIIYICKLPMAGDYSFINLIYNLLLINSWGVANDFSWNGPSWSLSAEWFLYLLFPFLAILFSRLKGLKTNIALILIILLAEYFIKKQDLSQINFFVFRGIIRGIFQFLYGIFIFNVYSIFPKKSIIYDCFSAFNFLLLLAVVYFSDQILNVTAYYSNQDMLIVFLMGQLIFSLSKCSGFMLNIFNSKVLQWLGLISYSMYMVHSPISQIMESLLTLNNIRNNMFIMPVYVLLVLLVATLTYRFVEAPTRDYIKNKVVN